MESRRLAAQKCEVEHNNSDAQKDRATENNQKASKG